MDADYLIKIIRGVVMVPHLQRSVARSSVNDYSLLLLSLSLSFFLFLPSASRLLLIAACRKSGVRSSNPKPRSFSVQFAATRSLLRVSAKIMKSVSVWFKPEYGASWCGEGFRLIPNRDSVHAFDVRRIAKSPGKTVAGWRPRVAGNSQIDRLSRLIKVREGARRGKRTRNYANARGCSLRNLYKLCV